MKKLLLIAAMLFCFPTYAQEKSDYFGLGAATGATSGVGLTHKGYLNDFGYQLTLGAFGSPNDMLMGSVGGNLSYTFAKMKYARLYGLVGVGTFFNRTVHPEYEMCDWNQTTQTDENCVTVPERFTHGAIANVGAGLGIEVLFWDTVGVSFDVPLSTSLGIGDGVELLGFFPIPNLSLVYYF